MLGEMKGRGNDKPAAKYHRHIISLLESDIVKGIQGGGYMPENNFSMNDLKPEEADALMEKKPTLATPLYYYKRNGVDDTLMKMVRGRGVGTRLYRYTPSLIKFSDDGKTAYLAEFNNVSEFVDYFGSDEREKRLFVWSKENIWILACLLERTNDPPSGPTFPRPTSTPLVSTFSPTRKMPFASGVKRKATSSKISTLLIPTTFLASSSTCRTHGAMH